MGARTSYRKHQQWKKWLSAIDNEVTGLVMYRYIYQEVGVIVRANPRLHVPSSFYDWIHQSYTQVMVLGISRLADTRKDVISFVRLMKDIEENP